MLKIVEGKKEAITYKGRFLLVETLNIKRDNIEKLLDQWYRSWAKIKFAEYAEPLINRFSKYNVQPKNLYIQKMETRWGVVPLLGILF